MEQRQKTSYIWNIVFFTGLLFGALITNLFFQNQAGIMNLWSFDPYSMIETGELAKKQYLVFLLLRRGKQLLGILCLLFFTNRMIGVGIPLFLFAFSISSLCALETMRMGIVGAILGMLYLVPHYLCYGMGIYGISRFFSNQKQSYKRIVLLVGLCVLWGVGCYMEAFLNPELMKWILSLVTKQVL